MNIVFDYNKNMKECSEFLESDYKLEYLNIDDKMLQSQDNIMSQLNEFKLPSDGLESIHDEPVFDFKSISSKSPIEEDLIMTPKFNPNRLINDTHFNFMDAKNFDFGNEFCLGKANPTVDLIEKTYPEKHKVDEKIVSLKHSENDQGLQDNFKLFCIEKGTPYVHSDQRKHHKIEDTKTTTKHQSLIFKRWGRDDDIRAFKTLRELCSQEDIAIETFWDEDFHLTKKHHRILKRITKKYKWKRNTDTMLKRITRLGKKQKMSARQIKLLKKLRRKAKKNKLPLNCEEIVHMFPGKLVSTLESCLHNL